MQVLEQHIADVIANLSPLPVDWWDNVAASAIAKLSSLPTKPSYDREDLRSLLNGNFEEGLLCARLFLMLSKDSMETELRGRLGPGGIGARRYALSPEEYLSVLESMGILTAMATTINYQPVWSDILVERLRAGRGSAIQGQLRGRGLEEFAEALVAEVFGDRGYEPRCTFYGADGTPAKCDIVIPDRNRPRIVIESKAYGATGSKMTDIIGDLDAIIAAKRHDTPLLFVTDGLTWNARLSDLRKIVQRQNQGKITRIYTTKMRDQFLNDLRTLKAELGLS